MAGRLPLLALSNELLGTLGYIDRGDWGAAAERIGHLHLRDESPMANWLRFHRPVDHLPVNFRRQQGHSPSIPFGKAMKAEG